MNLEATKTKSFWKKPEGITGGIFLAAIAGLGLYLLDKILPWIISLMQNTLHALLLAATVGGILFVVMDPRFRNNVAMMYKMVMKKMTGIIVELDPIAILRICIDDMKKNCESMEKQIGNLGGQMRQLKNIIQKNKDDYETNLKMAAQADKVGNKDLVTLKARKAGRLDGSNKTLITLHAKMELLYRMLSKMKSTAQIVIEDTEDEVNVKERERNAILSGHSALKSAMSIISGNPDKKALFDQAMEFTVDDIGQKAGEMERMMEVSTSFLDTIDIENGIFEGEGLKALEKWQEESVSTLLLGKDVKLLIAQTEDQNQVLNLDAPTAEAVPVRRSNNKYLDSLK